MIQAAFVLFRLAFGDHTSAERGERVTMSSDRTLKAMEVSTDKVWGDLIMPLAYRQINLAI